MAQAVLLLALVVLLIQQPWNLVVAAAQPGTPQAASDKTLLALDFEFYRNRVEPILLTPRKGNARCVACHSRGGGNSFLEPLQPGATTYSEEQSRRNYGRIQRLVVAGEPLRSLLLVNPLAEEAGGSHWHGGGKHWSSQNAAEWQTLAEWVRTTTVALDFDFYRASVEPILLTPRKGNARCVACHSRGGGNSFLEPLQPGATTYSEEQSRRNYGRIQRLVVAGEPLRSLLLVNPLAEEAGGSHWHGGGKHWSSQNAAEWRTLAAWVRGQPTGGSSR